MNKSANQDIMRNLIKLGILCTIALMSWQCKSFKGASVSVTPNPLEVHADSVKFTIKADVPPKSGFKKKGNYTGKLVIKNSGLTNDISTISISSEKYPDIKKAGASLTHKVNQPFNEAWDKGMLTAQNHYQRKKKHVDLPEIELAPCCITTPRLICDKDFKDNKTPEEANLISGTWSYTPSPPTNIQAKFIFPQDIFRIQPDEYQKNDIREIGSFITARKNATKITLSGFASPEGPFKRNQKLAINRLKEVQTWLIQQLKDNGNQVYLDSTFFDLTTTAEDWQGFKANLEQMNFDQAKKDEIIRIASEGWNEDLKEKKIMAIVGGADKVEAILAPLRRVTIKITGPSPDHSQSEIETAVKDFLSGKMNSTDFQNFFRNVEEFFAATEKTDSHADKKKILAELTQKYADDWRGHNNLGIYTMLLGDLDGGLNNLRTANAKNEQNHAIFNNMGICLKAMKRYEEAIEYFEKSLEIKENPQAAFSLGIVSIKKAKYDRGVELFERAIGNVSGNMTLSPATLACAFHNLGLCQLLVNEPAESKKALESSIEKDQQYALSYYVLAILGARNSDTEIMNTNLKKAAELNSQLAEKALTDLEFRKFKNTPEFKAAISM